MNYSGKGFVCIGDAHRFIDPIFALRDYFGIQEGEFATDVIGKASLRRNPYQRKSLCRL